MRQCNIGWSFCFPWFSFCGTCSFYYLQKSSSLCPNLSLAPIWDLITLPAPRRCQIIRKTFWFLLKRQELLVPSSEGALKVDPNENQESAHSWLFVSVLAFTSAHHHIHPHHFIFISIIDRFLNLILKFENFHKLIIERKKS